MTHIAPPPAVMHTSHMKNHAQWFQHITGHSSGRAAAQRAGLWPATLNRQLNRGELTAETVIAIARAYNHAPTTALAETGFLTPEEITGLPATTSAEILTDRDLIAELARRIGISVEDLTTDEYPDTTNQWAGWAADSSPLEPEPGDDNYSEWA